MAPRPATNPEGTVTAPSPRCARCGHRRGSHAFYGRGYARGRCETCDNAWIPEKAVCKEFRLPAYVAPMEEGKP